MNSPRDKGDALEIAVAAIEEVILRSSMGLNLRPTVEKKKIIKVNDVRHEIDIYVTTELAPGYKAIFIFECKNWQEAVGKNEIIIFSEKIDASSATSGCFVAKSLTADAVAQARTDPRVTLLLAAEHGPESGAEVFQFFSRIPEMTRIDVTFRRRGRIDLGDANFPLDNPEIIYLGRRVKYGDQLHVWSRLVCDESLMAFFEEAVPEGVYHRTVDRSLEFDKGELWVNGMDIGLLAFHIEYKVTVIQLQVESHFEVRTRGRFISFAPQLIGNDTMQRQVVIPSRT